MSAQLLAQASDRRRVEEGGHREVGIQGCVDRGDRPHRGQRIPAQVEKRLIDPDAVYPQHLGVDAGQDLLDQGCRGAIAITVAVYSGADTAVAGWSHGRPDAYRRRADRIDDNGRVGSAVIATNTRLNRSISASMLAASKTSVRYWTRSSSSRPGTAWIVSG